MTTEYMYNIYEELMKINKSNAAERAHGASIIMDHYKDKEMADTLRLLSAQLDFDDCSEANDAIKRTNEKLDKLIKEREQHFASAYIHYLTDDMVLAISGGEVTDLSYSVIESSFLKHGLFDPDIFGGSGKIPYLDDEQNAFPLKEYGTGIGHVELPCHVVAERDYQIIADLLHQKREDIKMLAKYASFVVTDPGDSDLKTGTILTEAEYRSYMDKNVSVSTGGDAIYDMLKALNYSDQPERLAFCILPVMSPVTRPIAYSRKKQVYCCDPLNYLYEKIIKFSKHIIRLLELSAPDIILNNEKRMLDNAINELQKTVEKQNSRRFCKKNKYAICDYYQRMIVSRQNMVSIVHIPSEKTGEIESLGIYPETIRVRSEDGTYEDVVLSDIINSCDDAMNKFQQEHAVVIPDGVDPEHLPKKLQKKVDEAEERYHKMEIATDAILDGAQKYRESFMVHIDETGMYIPCEMPE